MFGPDWWIHILTWGTLASTLSAGVLLTALLTAPYAFLSDFPTDIRQHAATPTTRQRRAGIIGGCIFVVTLFSLMWAVGFAWGRTQPEASFWQLWEMALVGFAIFTVIDTLVIDAVVICRWRPQRIIFTGTSDCAGWRDVGFHIKEAVAPRALAVLVLGSGVVGSVAWWAT